MAILSPPQCVNIDQTTYVNPEEGALLLSESVGMCRPLGTFFHPRYTLWLGIKMSNILLLGIIFYVLSHSLWVIFVKFSYLATLLVSFMWKSDTPVGVTIHPADNPVWVKINSTDPSALPVSGWSAPRDVIWDWHFPEIMILIYSIMMNPCGSPLPRFVVQCARSSTETVPVHWFVSLPNSYKHLQSWLSWFEVVEGLRCTNVLARDAQIKNKIIDQTSSNSFPESYKSCEFAIPVWVFLKSCIHDVLSHEKANVDSSALVTICAARWNSHSENKKELLISSFILLDRMLLRIRTIHLFLWELIIISTLRWSSELTSLWFSYHMFH